MTLRQRANLISALIIAVGLALTAALYFLYKILFLFIIFIPPIIYRLLNKNAGRNGGPFDGSENV